MKNAFDQYYAEAVEPGRRERAYAWATAIGLQDVDGLKPSKHLYDVAKRHIEGEISQEEARRIVDEYYETKDGHDLPADQEEADRVAARITAQVIETVGLKERASRNLLALMRKHHLVSAVKGRGKGKVCFCK